MYIDIATKEISYKEATYAVCTYRGSIVQRPVILSLQELAITRIYTMQCT